MKKKKLDNEQANLIKKLAIKTAGITFCCVVGLLILIFCILSVSSPILMSKVTHNIGIDWASAWYSSIEYNRTDKIEYIVYSTETCIRIKDDGGVEKYGEKLIANDNFKSYCEDQDKKYQYEGSYYQYYYGQISSSYYRLGNKEKGIDLAFSVNDNSFEKNNAIVTLLYTAIDNKDTNYCSTIGEKLEDFTVEEGQQAYLNSILSIIQQIKASNNG